MIKIHRWANKEHQRVWESVADYSLKAQTRCYVLDLSRKYLHSILTGLLSDHVVTQRTSLLWTSELIQLVQHVVRRISPPCISWESVPLLWWLDSPSLNNIFFSRSDVLRCIQLYTLMRFVRASKTFTWLCGCFGDAHWANPVMASVMGGWYPPVQKVRWDVVGCLVMTLLQIYCGDCRWKNLKIGNRWWSYR